MRGERWSLMPLATSAKRSGLCRVGKTHVQKGGTKMAGRILVPLDGSALAEQALPCAVTLARGLSSELYLLRVIWIPEDLLEILDETLAETDVIMERLESEAHEYLAPLAEELGAGDPVIHYAVRRGPVAETILEFIDRNHIDQIVMATHGYSGIRHWTHGSVAERVLQTARVPLLLVRASEQEQPIDRRKQVACRSILVPLDGSPLAEKILPVVANTVRAFGGKLTLFQVPIANVSGWMTGEWFVPIQGVLETAEEDSQQYLNDVAQRLQGQGLDVDTATAIGPVASSIIEHAEANHVDLIAMCTHGRTGLARWALGSVADRVLRAGGTPILLVRTD